MTAPARFSPSGAFAPFAVLGISTVKPFVSGTPLVIPFDTVQFVKGDIGFALGAFGPPQLQKPAISGYSFGIGAGLFLVTLRYLLSAAQGTSLKTQLTVSTGTHSYISRHTLGATNDGDALQCTALISAADTFLDPGNGILAGVGATITATGTSGNVTDAQLMIQRLTQP